MTFTTPADLAAYRGEDTITARHVYAVNEAHSWLASELNLDLDALVSPFTEVLDVAGHYVALSLPASTVTSVTDSYNQAVTFKLNNYWALRIPFTYDKLTVTYSPWDSTTVPSGVKAALLAYADAAATYKYGDIQSETVGAVSYTYRNNYEGMVARAYALLNPYRRFLPC